MRSILAGLALIAMVACRPLGPGPDDGGTLEQQLPEFCPLEPPTSCPTPAVTFEDVKPIFLSRCGGCHNRSSPQWPLDDYHSVADWNDEVRIRVRDCSMPPLDAGVPIELEERMKILQWQRCEFPP